MKGKNTVKLKLRGVHAAEVGYPKRLKTEYAFKEGILEISFGDARRRGFSSLDIDARDVFSRAAEPPFAVGARCTLS